MNQLRHMFGRPQNARVPFHKTTNTMILDFKRKTYNIPAAINLPLYQSESSSYSFNLPTPTATHFKSANIGQTLKELNADRLTPTLNREQRHAFEKIVDGIDNPSSRKLFYLNGSGGSGKTYLLQTLIGFIRGRGQIVQAYAYTGIAATLMQDGTTIHSGFGLPMLQNSTSRIMKNTIVWNKLQMASLLILDEITMLNKQDLEKIDNLLRKIMKNNLPFGGKVVVISGDFRQTLPIDSGNRKDRIQASIISSPLWRHFQQLPLINNMRSAGQYTYNQWLLKIGNGYTPHINGLSENAVEIPEEMITQEEIITKIFMNNIRNLSADELSQRVILTPTNEVALSINAKIIDQLDGELETYCSADGIVSDDPNTGRIYPVKFLNGLTPSGVPPHKLYLKKGSVVMLIRNLDTKKGLCNGTRMIVLGLNKHCITCKILSENHKGDIVSISRINITSNASTLPFLLKRYQFPIIPAFAITINKSQGQSYDIVGVFLNEPVFDHGQLYVALSRCKNPSKISVFIKDGPKQGRLLNDNRYFTVNIVDRDVLCYLQTADQ